MNYIKSMFNTKLRLRMNKNLKIEYLLKDRGKQPKANPRWWIKTNC